MTLVLLHIRGERNEDILFRLVTPYAIHEVPLHLVSEVGCLFFGIQWYESTPGHEEKLFMVVKMIISTTDYLFFIYIIGDFINFVIKTMKH